MGAGMISPNLVEPKPFELPRYTCVYMFLSSVILHVHVYLSYIHAHALYMCMYIVFLCCASVRVHAHVHRDTHGSMYATCTLFIVVQRCMKGERERERMQVESLATPH